MKLYFDTLNTFVPVIVAFATILLGLYVIVMVLKFIKNLIKRYFYYKKNYTPTHNLYAEAVVKSAWNDTWFR